ncbi:MAG: hypothetical protein QOE76_2492 [Frankiales bacterium]|nr:hypothetical protein [Frankiales bacterium]
MLSWTRESAADYLQTELERTGQLPLLSWRPPDWVESCPDPLIVPTDVERDVEMLRCFTAPTRYTLSRLWPGGLSAIWLGAGLADCVRTSRGVVSVAADGHACRSLLERYVDDWLSSHHITHSCEPQWPCHPTLNAGGFRRADWLLEGDVYVEMAGMLDDPIYAAKIDHKRQLAMALGVELIVLTPDDLGRLDVLLPGPSSLLRPGLPAPDGAGSPAVDAVGHAAARVAPGRERERLQAAPRAAGQSSQRSPTSEPMA